MRVRQKSQELNTKSQDKAFLREELVIKESSIQAK